ncbi:hypothetical protein ACSNOK_17590 [Streptomyces sp. URMC 126]
MHPGLIWLVFLTLLCLWDASIAEAVLQTFQSGVMSQREPVVLLRWRRR